MNYILLILLVILYLFDFIAFLLITFPASLLCSFCRKIRLNSALWKQNLATIESLLQWPDGVVQHHTANNKDRLMRAGIRHKLVNGAWLRWSWIALVTGLCLWPMPAVIADEQWGRLGYLIEIGRAHV